MNNKILVIGATGNVGHTVVELLAAQGEKVKAASRQPERLPAQTNVEVVQFNSGDPLAYSAALAEVNRVFLMAAVGNDDPAVVLAPFIDAASAAGVQHVVLMTALGIDQGPDVGLRVVEKHLMGSGIAYTILRPNWFMQNFNPGFILPMIQSGGAFYLPASDAKTSFIDTRDIAAVAVKALTEAGHAGHEYGLTGSESLSYYEAAALLSQAAGQDIRYVPISDEDFRHSLNDAGWPPERVQMMSGLFAGVRQGWAASVLPIVAQVLGRAPITLAQFAHDNAAAWQREMVPTD